MMRLIQLLTVIALVGQSAAIIAQDPNRDFRDMEKYYEQGDYVKATQKAISFLRVRPKKKKAQEILSIAFNMATEDLRSEISDLKNLSRSFTGDETVIRRRTIIEKYELLKDLDRKGREIIRVIPKQKVPLEFDRVDVSTQLIEANRLLDEATLQAADMHYEEGLELQKRTDRVSQKKAAKEFKSSMRYVLGYMDADVHYAKARDLATTRVAILPFANKSGTRAYGEVGEMTSDKLRAGILNSSQASEFIEIYTRDQLNVVIQEHHLNATEDIMNKETIAKFGEALGIHIIITGKVMQVAAEYRQTIHDGARITRATVVVGQENYIDNRGNRRTRNKLGEVSARNYHHHKSAIATINGSYEMIDVESGRVLASDQFREEYEWKNSWSTYSGDQRAAQSPSGFDSGEKAPPSKTELANEVIDRLGAKVARDVIGFVR